MARRFDLKVGNRADAGGGFLILVETKIALARLR